MILSQRDAPQEDQEQDQDHEQEGKAKLHWSGALWFTRESAMLS
jgi:hypothetical protein